MGHPWPPERLGDTIPPRSSAPSVSGETGMERKLAAILEADMVGYSRLMAADEAVAARRQDAAAE